MLESIIILLALIATAFNVVALVVPHFLRSLYAAAIALVIWLALAAGSVQVGVSYAFENTSDHGVMSGVQQVSGTNSYIALIFLFLAVITGLYIWMITSEQVMEKGDKHGKGEMK